MTTLAPPNWRTTTGIHRRGNRTDQPDADTVTIGTLYYIVDDGVIEYSDGVTWLPYVGSGSRSSTLVNYSFSLATTSPPGVNQVRFNALFPYTAVTRLRFDNITADGQDIHTGFLFIQTGSRILVQDKNDHTQYAVFETTNVPTDFVTWVELEVIHIAHGSAIGGGQLVLVQSNGGSPSVPPLHHATHETGGTDVINHIDASVIDGGTLSDARLSSNVAMRNAANTFTVNKQTVSNTFPLFDFIDTSQIADKKLFRLANSAQEFYIQALNDAESVAEGYVKVGRPGDLAASRNIYEKARTTPIGHWITVAFNAANFGAIGGGSWTVGSAAVPQNSYMLIGKTMFWRFYISWFSGSNTVAGVVNTLTIVVPGGVTANGSQIQRVGYGIDGGAFSDMYTTLVGTSLQIGKTNGAAFTAGSPGVVTNIFMEFL